MTLNDGFIFVLKGASLTWAVKRRNNDADASQICVAGQLTHSSGAFPRELE